MALAQQQLRSSLPARLVDFFNRYPPQLYSAKFTGVTIPLTRRDAKIIRIAESEQQKHEEALKQQGAQYGAPTPSSSPISTASPEATRIQTSSITDSHQTSSSTPSPAETKPPRHPFPPNPFLPFRNPATGRWAGPRFGLRQQADLVKLAKAHKVEALLPPGRKATAFKEQRILEKGLRVKGTGEGEKVKGHIWERTLQATLLKRREALEQMPALVREWERRGHGRGWKKWPKVRTK